MQTITLTKSIEFIKQICLINDTPVFNYVKKDCWYYISYINGEFDHFNIIKDIQDPVKELNNLFPLAQIEKLE